MAKPIKETPVLRGKESDSFLRAVKENETRKVSRDVYVRTKKTYHKIMDKMK